MCETNEETTRATSQRHTRQILASQLSHHDLHDLALELYHVHILVLASPSNKRHTLRQTQCAAHRHNAYPGLPKLALQSITDGIARLELAQVCHTSRSTQRNRSRSRSHAAGNSSSLPNARSVADS